jgi:hypothetical protein
MLFEILGKDRIVITDDPEVLETAWNEGYVVVSADPEDNGIVGEEDARMGEAREAWSATYDEAFR